MPTVYAILFSFDFLRLHCLSPVLLQRNQLVEHNLPVFYIVGQAYPFI